MEYKSLFFNLRKFISVIDNLRDVGLQKHIKLPRIVTLGTQSSGKSSLLESAVGMDFLPRGEGVCTRRPLELRLVHMQENSSNPAPPYGEFEAIKNKKFTNFEEIKRNIELLTDKVAGTKKGIIDDPIVLTIHSSTCPDLTLVDLPGNTIIIQLQIIGITRIPLKDSDQPENIEEITMKMAHRYISDERTIILCVIAANQDLSTSDALKMARQIDPKGMRTIGVLTKIDIMDKGTTAKNILLNKEVPLRLGYIGVKNRNQQDIKDSKKLAIALKEEKVFFSQHPIYSTLPPGLLGTEVLTSKLSNQLFDHIRKHLPDIMKEIQIKSEECQERLRLLGPTLPKNDYEKTQLIWDMVTRFSLQFRNSIEGKYSTDANLSLSQPEGAKIRIMFIDFFQEFMPEKFTASNEYTDKDISKAIKKHEGDSLPGFYGQDAFLYLLDPILDRLKEPSQECVNEIFILLEKLANELLSKECQRFPQLLQEMQDHVVKILDTVREREKTKEIVEDVINSEIGYLFTSDQSFFRNFFETVELPTQTNQKQPSGQQQPAQPEILTEEKVRSLIIKEMRNKMDIYFKIVVRNLRDRIPKTIGYFFIKRLQDTIQLQLIQELNNDEELKESLKEPSNVQEERNRLLSTISVLKNSTKIIKRDPDLQAFIYASKINSAELEKESNIVISLIRLNHVQKSSYQGQAQPLKESIQQKQEGQQALQQSNAQKYQQPISQARTQPPSQPQMQQSFSGANLSKPQQQQQPSQHFQQLPQQSTPQVQIKENFSGKNLQHQQQFLQEQAPQYSQSTNATFTPKTQFSNQPSQATTQQKQQQQQQQYQQQQQQQNQFKGNPLGGVQQNSQQQQTQENKKETTKKNGKSNLFGNIFGN